MPPGEYTITIKQIDHNYLVFSYEMCLFLSVTDTVKYRMSQFYATNHKSHQNAMYLTGYCFPLFSSILFYSNLHVLFYCILLPAAFVVSVCADIR